MMPLARIERASSSMRASSIVRARLKPVGAEQVGVDVEGAFVGAARRRGRVGNQRAESAAEGGSFVSHGAAPCLMRGGAASRASTSRASAR